MSPVARLPWLAVALASPWVALCVTHSAGWLLRPAHVGEALWVLVGSPCLEEVIYRAGVQRPVWTYFETRPPHLGSMGPARAAAWVATATFVVVHAPAHGWMALAWAVPAFALSELYRQTRTVWPCVVLHAWFNASLWWASV